MEHYNDIGISSRLDWPRIRRLLKIGLLASVLHVIGDMILGWGLEDEALTGLERMLSAYTGTSDGGIFAAALLGLLGMVLEGLAYFGVYRLIAPYSQKDAHSLRTGILGYLIFGACGFHVPTCALVFLTKHGVESALLLRCAAYFMLPAFILFWVFFAVLNTAQIRALAKEKMPLPKACWAFSMPVGMLLAMLPGVLGNRPLVNALACAWIAVGNLWMFGGLTVMANKAQTPC